MTQDPEADVAAYLAGVSGLALTSGTNLFTGPPLAQAAGVPAEAVFVEAQPTETPEPNLSNGNGRPLTNWPAEVEVVVRGPPGDRNAARLKARACMDALHAAPIVGYHIVLVDDGVPEYQEQDDAQCHEYAFAVRMEWMA